MTVRAWATLAVRGFALYNIFVHGSYLIWQIGARIIGGGNTLRGVADSGPELASALLYPAVCIALSVVLLIVSDGLIRFIARVPGESPDKPA